MVVWRYKAEHVGNRMALDRISIVQLPYALCVGIGCPKFISSITETTYNSYFFVIEIANNVLSLSTFWRHLANVKIVNIRHLNGHISYINNIRKMIFL